MTHTKSQQALQTKTSLFVCNANLKVLAGLLLVVGSIFVFTPTCSASATNIYIAQNSAGAGNGADCADAVPVSFFSSGANWGSSSNQIGPGTTVHLCGTFTAGAGASNYLQFQGSGSSGSPITLHFETGAVLTATYWSGPAILIGANNYITIDGGTNGTIQATANGTGLANQQDNGTGVDCGSVNICSNITVENLTVSNIYVHTCTTVVSSCTDEGGGNTLGIRLWGGTNDTITGNTIHDVHWAIVMLYGTSSTNSTNLVVSNNTTYNHDHGIAFADPGSNSTATGSNCSNAIHDNDVGSMTSWDDAGDDNHHDAIHTFANNAPGSNYYVCVYNNYLHGDGGVTFNSMIFIESQSENSLVFNNVLDLTANNAAHPSGCTGTGILGPATGSGTNGQSLGVYNNTVVGYSTSQCEAFGMQEQTNPTYENNIGSTAFDMLYASSVSGTLTIDYNLWYNSSNGWVTPGCSSSTFSTWQSSCGFDTHGKSANPNLTSAFALNTGSPGIGMGKNLTSLGITALNVDKAGVARPTSGAWDAGAIQFAALPPVQGVGIGIMP